MYNKHKMYEGGLVSKPRSAKVFRYAGLFIPIVLIIYGVCIQNGVLGVSHIIDNFGFLLFTFWWLFISTIQFLFPIKTKLDASLRLIAYHLLSGSFLVFISGVSSPIVGLWILLTLASYVYFSKRGFILNILFLTIVVF